VALAPLIVAYAVGMSVLQSAYQRGDALTAAGTATMVPIAVPIAAGFVLFGETLPHGPCAVLQVAAFACLVVSAVALGHRQAPQAGQLEPGEPGPGRRCGRAVESTAVHPAGSVQAGLPERRRPALPVGRSA
jgi:hypothetical protein